MSTQTNLPLTNGGVSPEQEPCLTIQDEQNERRDSDSATKVPPGDETRLERYEMFLKEKSGLSRRGLLIAACVVALLLLSLIVVIVLASCWPKTPHEWEYPLCRSQECLESSKKMLSMMEASADPCQDLYRYSCGSWLERHRRPPPDKSRWSLAEEAAFAHVERVRTLLTTLPHTLDFVDVGWKLQHFYESCLSLEYIDTDRDRPLKRIISELGGWSVLREFSMLNWDYKRTLEQLHSQHGVAPFFKVSVVPDARFLDSPTRKNVIQISPSGLGLPDRSYYYRHPDDRLLTSYKRYLKDAAQALGATSVDAGKFTAEMFYYEKRLAEVTPDAAELADPLATYNPRTLSELKLLAPSIPLHEILVAKYPKAGIDDSTKVIVTSPAYLGNISLIVSTTDRGSMNNYLMWQLTRSYLPYLSKEYQDIVNYHNAETTGTHLPAPRWEFCARTVERWMGDAVGTLLEMSTSEHARQRAYDETNRVFEAIRSLLEQTVRQSAMQEHLKDQVLDKLITLGLQVGRPVDLLSESHLKSLYSTLPVKRADLFSNVGYGVAHAQAQEGRRLVEGGVAGGGVTREGAWYDEVEHRVVVSMSAALKTQLPPSSLYGSLGVDISRAIVASITPPGVVYKPRGDLLEPGDPAVQEAGDAASRAASCLARDAANLTTARTVADTVDMVTAVKHAAKALSASGSPHVHQPALEWLESDALFYVSLAQATCEVATPEQEDLDRTTSDRLTGEDRLRAVLRQLPHFRATFSCAQDARYATAQPCADIL